MKLDRKPGNTYWGLALAWYAEYTAGGNPNPYLAKMDFLERYGMRAFMASVEEIHALAPSEQEVLFQALAERDMHVILHSNIDRTEIPFDEMDRETDEQLKLLEQYIPLCRSDIVTTCAVSHRYDRKFPWDEKVKRFSKAMSPVAKLCWDLGAPFCIENHADYFVSELLDVLRETPRLYFFLDTANALHIGEQPVTACVDAAPYVVGTHFKDHYMVRGEHPPLHYEIRGCALGDGDAELDKQYKIIMEKSPFRDKLVMLFELFTPEDKSLTHIQCFERSVAFVKTL